MFNSFSKESEKKSLDEQISDAERDGYNSQKLGFLNDDNPYDRQSAGGVLFKAWHAGWVRSASEGGKS